MSERILGLDIGIASVGWAVVDYDKEQREKNKIVKSGVRIFTQAEHPKDGSSLAMPRRLARGARRTNKRKRQRMKGIKNLFIKYLSLTKDDLFVGDDDKTIYGKKGRIDIWQLRDEAVKRVLTADELARVLTHIAKRRGYKSNRKSLEEKDTKSDNSKALGGIANNKVLSKKYLTAGQMLYQTTKDTGIRRNKPVQDIDKNRNSKIDKKTGQVIMVGGFFNSISREMLLDEVNIIFRKQKEFNNILVNDVLRDEYIAIAFHQRDFASVADMVGDCTFEKGVKRAAKRTYSAEEFVTLTKLINIKIVDKEDKERKFTPNELEKVIELCKQEVKLKGQIGKPSYIKIKELLGLENDIYFKGIELYIVDKNGEVTKKPALFKSAFKGYHELRSVVTEILSPIHWHNLAQDKTLLNEIATIFSLHKSDEKIREALLSLTFSMFTKEEKTKIIGALLVSISFDQFINLSHKALDKIVPHMQKGKRYDEAVELVGYKKKEGTKEKLLRALSKEEQNELTNPVVKRAIAQTRKVVNALIREYGQFSKVHIELARDIKRSYKDRKEREQGQKKYKEFKDEVEKHFIQLFGRKPRGAELLKFRLWKEQDGFCMYSGYLGEKISTDRLISDFKYAEIDHILPYSRSLDDGLNNKVLCLAKENQEKKNQTPYEYFISKGRDLYSYEVFIKNILKGLNKVKKTRLLKKNFDENSAKEFRERNINDTAYMAKYIKNFIEENLELTSKSKKKVLSVNGTLTNMLRYNWGVGTKSRNTHLHHAVDAILIAFATDSEVQRLSTLSAKIEGFNYQKSAEKAKKIRFIPPLENFRDEVQKSINAIFVSNAPRRKITGSAHKETIVSKKVKSPEGKFEVNGGIAENGEVKRVDIFLKNKKYHMIFIYTADFEKNKLPDITIDILQN
ncbi:MAG: CRISPR-associated protein, Csn1 family [uncultured Sulfurovum sp.]|uniref:CRISPR-associated endonuclease Cas9 n=1 Tax=uncultured Sulfurovum sp. TaxID=269237 RepID=A0A6S6TF39_9BACT|nr:MAG: CRISPR-associated protein, Csn1 family [uncultured Sulfurovum sp.]